MILLFVWVIVSLFILSLIRKQFVKFLSLASIMVTGSTTLAKASFSFLFFPGVVIHELSHFISATLLGVPTGSIELIPKMIGKEIKLGSVKVAKTDILRTSIIGTAPLLMGILAIYFLLSFQYPYLFENNNIPSIISIFSHQFIWTDLANLYFIFAISNTMLLSQSDKKGIIPALIVATAVLVAVYLTQEQIDFDFFASVLKELLFPLGVIFSVVVLLNLLMLIPLLSLIYVFQKITGKKVKLG